jgi:predicted Rossmann-fold nucleotide-binding protein
MKRICVFCGSSAGSRWEYGAAAEEMAAILCREKLKSGSWASFA